MLIIIVFVNLVKKIFAKNVQIIDGGYDPEPFFEMARGRENLPERGARCYDCYKLRLAKTFAVAQENGFDYFSTTLSISPYKNAEWLNEIGMELERTDGPIFLFSDFKKENGYITYTEDFSVDGKADKESLSTT